MIDAISVTRAGAKRSVSGFDYELNRRQPRLLHGFSLERLLHFLLALDQDVEIIVRPKVKDHSHLNVTLADPR